MRESNMELLRICSMFFVLLIHANVAAYTPSPQNVVEFLSVFLESLTVVCVNSFIMLSGWFGIKFSFKKLFSLVFQVLFFSIVLSFLPGTEYSFRENLFDIFTINQYPFIRGYILLFIISPLLNVFAEKASEVLFRQVLLSFFIVQTIFAYLSPSIWYDDGYAPVPYIGLYLLSRYIRIYRPKWAQLRKSADASIYLLLSLIIALLNVVLYKTLGSGGRMFNYTNPLVITSSVFFVLFFSKLSVKNNWVINWIAVSSVGAYLLQMNPGFNETYYLHTLEGFIREYSAFQCVCLSGGFVLLVFVSGVLLDKVSVLLWRGVSSAVIDK